MDQPLMLYERGLDPTHIPLGQYLNLEDDHYGADTQEFVQACGQTLNVPLFLVSDQ